MLQPARRKFRKEQKGRNTGIATRGANVSFGEFGLKATERGRITARQIEAARRAISRHIKRGGRIFIRIFPDKPISRSLPKSAWATARATPSTTWPRSSRARCCTRSTACPSNWLARRSLLASAKLPLRTHLRRAPGRHLIAENQS
jgi:large subunit ribosomal protein L16